MMDFDFKILNDYDIPIKINKKDNTIAVAFSGIIEIDDSQDILEQYFETLHEKIVGYGLNKIYCDFTNLDFINSNGIKCILQWILKNAKQSDTQTKYNMILIINDALKWQIDGIAFLKKIAPDLIFLEYKNV